jgi:cytoskeletal protein CcmA (bactofilin family)
MRYNQLATKIQRWTPAHWKVFMWGRRKPDDRQAATPELKSQRNQPPRYPVASLEGTMQLNKEAMGPTGAMKDSVASRLGANLHMKGEITGSEDLLIDGSVEGLVQLDERKLTIGKTAKVTADIIVGEVLVCGIVKGNVRAKTRIEIRKDGSVDGDLNTAQVMIEDGAVFKGSIEIETGVGKEDDGNMCSQTTSESTTQKATRAGARSKSAN